MYNIRFDTFEAIFEEQCQFLQAIRVEIRELVKSKLKGASRLLFFLNLNVNICCRYSLRVSR